MNEFGKKIESQIQILNTTQKEIAEKAGISKTALNNYIKTDRLPDILIAIKLSLLLGFDIYDVYGVKHPHNDSSTLSKSEIKLIRSRRKLSSQQKEAFDQAAVNLAKFIKEHM